MKKTLSILTLFALLVLSFSCSRETENQVPTQTHEQLIHKFRQKLKTDKSFINFTKSYLNSSIISAEVEINKKLNRQNVNLAGKTAEELTRDAVYDTTTNAILFYDQNPDFDLLTDSEKTLIISDILEQALLTVNTTIQKNSNASFKSGSIEEAVLECKNNVEELNDRLPSISGKRAITWGEVGVCVVGAAADYIGSNWTLIKGLYGLLQGENLTFGVVKAAVQLFFPEAAMASTVIGLAGCLIGAYFF